MAEYIDKAVLYNKLAHMEELARDRFLDTPFDSPAWTRYQSQLNERTALKQMIADEPAADVAPTKRAVWEQVPPHDRDGNDWVYVCSECKSLELWQTKFCPDCGAKMDGRD